MPSPKSGRVTEPLQALSEGDERAADALLPEVYDELRRLAHARMAHERPGQTLQPTALVHEAYMRLVGKGDPGWNGRNHFFGAAAEAMRRILVERARRRNRVRHGGELLRVPLDEADGAELGKEDEILGVDSALARLEELDPDMARIVKLRYFVGLTVGEVAELTGSSERSVYRTWSAARAWLRREIRGEAP